MKPLPLAILRQTHLLSAAPPLVTPCLAATSKNRLVVLPFYFLLLRPGKYSSLPSHAMDNLFA